MFDAAGQQQQQQQQQPKYPGAPPAGQAASAPAASSAAQSDAEALRQKEASAWIAHKAEDGQVCFQSSCSA